MVKRVVENGARSCIVHRTKEEGQRESAGMRNTRAYEEGPARPGETKPPFPGKSPGRRVHMQVAIAALSALLTLAVGIVSAADVCKLSVCWLNEQAKNDYECEQSCYFEEDPLDASNAAQCTSLARPGHEDNILHMYRDNSSQCTGGCVTVGIGNLLRTVEDAVALQGMFMIVEANGQQRAATEQEIRDEFNSLPHQPSGCSGNSNQCYGHTYYGRQTSLAISTESSNQLCQGRLDGEFIPGLKRIYGDEAWDNMPSRVQYALVDLIYNVGERNLRDGWPNLNAAVRNQDWATAAVQSNRAPPISPARNAYVRGLLDAAAVDNQTGTDRLARCPP